MQIHESKDGKSYQLYVRYGRVGAEGMTTQNEYSDKEKVVKDYQKTLKTKTNKGYKVIDKQIEGKKGGKAKGAKLEEETIKKGNDFLN